MSGNVRSRKRSSDLLLRVSTIQGIVYEKYIDFLSVCKKDGVMIVNRNYSPVLEQLADGEIIVHERAGKVVISVVNSWLTVSNNICYVYGTEAKIVSP